MAVHKFGSGGWRKPSGAGTGETQPPVVVRGALWRRPAAPTTAVVRGPVRGRPRADEDGEVLVVVSATLRQRDVDRARRVGEGNLSLGLRRLLDT